MAQIVNLFLIFEPDANNEPKHIITICYTEMSLHIKHFMKHKTYSSSEVNEVKRRTLKQQLIVSYMYFYPSSAI